MTGTGGGGLVAAAPGTSSEAKPQPTNDPEGMVGRARVSVEKAERSKASRSDGTKCAEPRRIPPPNRKSGEASCRQLPLCMGASKHHSADRGKSSRPTLPSNTMCVVKINFSKRNRSSCPTVVGLFARRPTL